jgi:sugar phosphate isomerase/epimerase
MDDAIDTQTRLPVGLGLPSLLYGRLSLAEALELLAPRTSLVEIHSYGRHSLLCAENRGAAERGGLMFVVHGPYSSELDPASLDEVRRRWVVNEHRRQAEAAAEIGARCYVAHPDRRPQAGPFDPASGDALRRTLAELECVQDEVGLPIGIENMPGYGLSHFSAPGDLDLGELGLVLDCGHAAISGTLQAFLEDPAADLVHVHLHSNDGPCEPDDPHRPLGQGIVDAAPVLALARTVGATVTLEHDDDAAAAASISYLAARGLLGVGVTDAAPDA